MVGVWFDYTMISVSKVIKSEVYDEHTQRKQLKFERDKVLELMVYLN